MGQILDELNQVLSEKDRIVAGVAGGLHSDLLVSVPVQTGQLRQSWTIKEVKNGWLLENPMPYAELRYAPLITDTTTGKIIQGSKQNPAGIEGIIDQHERNLQRLLKGIK